MEEREQALELIHAALVNLGTLIEQLDPILGGLSNLPMFKIVRYQLVEACALLGREVE